jgi:hypothetical protein
MRKARWLTYVRTELATIKQLINPSEMASAIACRSKFYHHRPRLRKQPCIPCARQVRERGILQRRRGCRRDAQDLACPAVDRTLELRCGGLRSGGGGGGGVTRE